MEKIARGKNRSSSDQNSMQMFLQLGAKIPALLFGTKLIYRVLCLSVSLSQTFLVNLFELRSGWGVNNFSKSLNIIIHTWSKNNNELMYIYIYRSKNPRMLMFHCPFTISPPFFTSATASITSILLTTHTYPRPRGRR